MENNNQRKQDYAPALEKSTKAQYGLIITMCFAAFLFIIGFGALVAYAHWDTIQRLIA